MTPPAGEPGVADVRPANPLVESSPGLPKGLVSLRNTSTAMGGRLVLRVTTQPDRVREAERDLDLVAGRVRAWASILTRHGDDSPLLRLNRDPRPRVPVCPTLAAVLGWAAEAAAMTDGIVDATLLDERLAAEGVIAPKSATRTVEGRHPLAARRPAAAWAVRPDVGGAGRHRRPRVIRNPGIRFDLDGVAKGWIADRALGLLGHHPGAIVDADGDIALRLAPGESVDVGVGDPRMAGTEHLAILTLAADRGPRSWGVATSGTSVHRWPTAHGETHHLIDPRTRRPASTDIVQATVVAETARTAEAFAKTAVVLGAADALDVLDRAGLPGAILLLRDGRVVALPRTMELVA